MSYLLVVEKSKKKKKTPSETHTESHSSTGGWVELPATQDFYWYVGKHVSFNTHT